jgi:hypothetical protein
MRAASVTGPLGDLAARAGYQLLDRGTLPLLRHVAAVRAEPEP